MRVLMTADAVGGVWRYSLELTQALAARDVEVTLAVMGGGVTDGHRAEAVAAGAHALHVSDLALEWMDEPWPDVDAAGVWLRALAEEARPDVVHLNGYVHAVVDWPAPTLVVAHSDVCSWWMAVHGEAPPREWDEYRRRVSDGLAAADAVVAPTAAVLAELSRWYGLAGGTVIPNGRATGWIRAGDKESLVVGAGRVWDDAKNLRALDRVAARLGAPVVIAGDATHPGSGKQVLSTATATGPLPFEDLACLLARAAVFASPARYEPFGLAALEAGLSHCALVLGDIPSLREVWNDAAVFVDPGDDDGLTAALRSLLDDADRAAAWGDRARERAATFTIDRTADAYLQAYRSLPAPVGGPR